MVSESCGTKLCGDMWRRMNEKKLLEKRTDKIIVFGIVLAIFFVTFFSFVMMIHILTDFPSSKTVGVFLLIASAIIPITLIIGFISSFFPIKSKGEGE